MNGEYLLSLDPYNFNTIGEYLKFYAPDVYKKRNKKMLEEIKIKIEKAIENTREYRNTHTLNMACAQYHTGTMNGYMRALDIIKEVENDKNNK